MTLLVVTPTTNRVTPFFGALVNLAEPTGAKTTQTNNAAGATREQLAEITELQRQAMWRLDFISSENSMGFHADQEAMRILGESIDYSRQAEILAIKLAGGATAPATEESK
jgi:formate-dependent nitrite reductase cytochrome c552 subunit